jgi:tetratricopeptide (TPR) repeat protein
VDIDMFNEVGAGDRLGTARELLQQGELEQALAEVDRVVGLFGKSVAALELQVEIQGAIDRRNLSSEEEAQIWFDRGNEQYFSGDFVSAISSYDQALQIKSNHYEAWKNRGSTLGYSGQYELAIASFDQALKIKPDDHEAWNYRGAALDCLSQYESAITSYDQALKIDPDYYQAWTNRGNALIALGQYEAAITSYNHALQIKPDDNEVWNNHGSALFALGQYETAITSYDQALKIKPDDNEVWNNRGSALFALGQYEAAITSYDQALKIKPDDNEAWFSRGNPLFELGQYESAIASYDQALQIKSDNDKAWYCHGTVLVELGQYEAAIASYDQALQIKPDKYEAWYNRGTALLELGQYEAAIASHDQAVKIKPDLYEAWTNRGLALVELGQYEAAIASYDQALQIKPNCYGTWNNRGGALVHLRRYEAAIASYEQALKHNHDHHHAWIGRGTAFCRLGNTNFHELTILDQIHRQNSGRPLQKSHIEALREALLHIPQDTTGFGEIHLALGGAYLKHNRGSNPSPQWRDAKRSYNLALKNLPETNHRKDHLSALWGFCNTSLLLEDEISPTLDALLRKGTEIRDRILAQAHSDEQRERLSRTLPNFNELTVDFHLSQGNNIAALETAEADKNGLMQWLLPVPGTANYAEMRETIGIDTALTSGQPQAIVYWYLGANAIATFVIRADQAEPIVVTEFDREISLKMRDRLDEWIKAWNKSYTNHNAKSKDSDIETDNTWRNTLSTQLADLAEILDIAKLLPHLQNIQNLILVPHRDLHRFPLHTFFPQAKITYLPSLHLGRHLRSPQRLTQAQLLSIEAPAHNGAPPLYHAGIESIALRYLHPNHLYLAPDQSDQPTFLQAIAQPHTHLHFNGHANHNPDNPKHSEMMLQGNDTLTLNTFRQSPYHPSQIVTLAACETGITNAQTITAEYVGWVSAFLSRDVPYVLSTLWTVHSEATALFMMQFYRQLQRHQSPVIAHHQAQQWLRHLTVRKLARLYQVAIPHQTGEVFEFLEIELLKLGKMEKSDLPYADPYYWAAFILSGRPNSL